MKKLFGSRILAVLTAAALFSAQQCTVFAAGDGGGSFVFSDTGIQVSSGASGYESEGTSLTVDTPGTYTVSGKCAKVSKSHRDIERLQSQTDRIYADGCFFA